MIDEKKLIEDIEREFDGVCTYDVSPSQAVSDFIEIVDRQPPADQWIPCKMGKREAYGRKINISDTYMCSGSTLAKLAHYEMLEAQGRLAYMPEPYKGE